MASQLPGIFISPVACIGGVFLALILASPGASSSPPIEPGISRALAQWRSAHLSDIRYRLLFDIPADPAAAIPARVVISFHLNEVAGDLQLDYRASPDTVQSIRVNGTAAPHRTLREHIVLPAGSLARGQNRVAIEILAGPGSLNRNPEYLYSLFVPDRARSAFPLFDQPDLKATWELTLVTPAGWKAVTNAPLREIRQTGDHLEHHFKPSDPISSYLFAFVAGRFDTVTREIDGRSMTLYHRETDGDKLMRSVDDIFALHRQSLDWLEDYTGIDYPFQKFDVVLVPDFQYRGMEHPGAILYRASALLLDPAPSRQALLRRAQLIAHESAHMWFGNLVTMRWFDDVWTKEVFANFMADKIVNPAFPEIDHDLAFIATHYPPAYRVDRTAGANPIRQPLPNLNEAGQLYGDIIYHKAPIMMHQLEQIMGENAFRRGVRAYLQRFAHANASWPELVGILDKNSDAALTEWSSIWVDTPGRPRFFTRTLSGSPEASVLAQVDDASQERIWPQRFDLMVFPFTPETRWQLVSDRPVTPLPPAISTATQLLFNADGYGYGLFPLDIGLFDHWARLPASARGSLLVNAYENLLQGSPTGPEAYFQVLLAVLEQEQDELLLQLAMDQLSHVYESLLPPATQAEERGALEAILWRGVLERHNESTRKLFFERYSALANSPAAIDRLRTIWSRKWVQEGLQLEEDELISLTGILAVRLPEKASALIELQQARTVNPDSQRRLTFITPALSADRAVRDNFFSSLANEDNRQTEPWVLEALRLLHHPTRISEAERYLLPILELLQEIQVTGDIFFPGEWLKATLARHHSTAAVDTVRTFLADHPHYNHQLRMKILQSADMLYRVCRIRGGSAC